MISGDSARRSFSLPVPDPPKSSWTAVDKTQEALQQKAIGFTCLHYFGSEGNEGALSRHSLPDRSLIETCVDGLRLELAFPSCWDGRNLDSPSHRTHVVFPDLVTEGECPAGYPYRIPALYYESIWDTFAWSGKSGNFVLANGDTTGNGYHGDFLAAWPNDVLQSAFANCTSMSGKVEDCGVFDLQDPDMSSQCHLDLPEALVGVDVYNPQKGSPEYQAIVQGRLQRAVRGFGQKGLRRGYR